MSTTNPLIDLMKEYGVEVWMLGSNEKPDPMSIKVADMLTEIHRLRPYEFTSFAADVQQWQRETFPGGTAVGAANHLLEEAGELADELERFNETDDYNALGMAEEEAADVFLLLIAVSGLVGFDLMDAAKTKMAKNRARVWETAPNDRGYRKHIEQEGGEE